MEVFVVVLHGDQLLAHLDVGKKFFFDLSCKRLLWILVRLYLAAREFPAVLLKTAAPAESIIAPTMTAMMTVTFFRCPISGIPVRSDLGSYPRD